jgi:hypothetical protein
MAAAAVYIIFIHKGALNKRLVAAAAALAAASLPFIRAKLARKRPVKRLAAVVLNAGCAASGFAVSAAALCILCGFSLPAALIASSTAEFSYTGSFSSPFPFLANTCVQAIGLFLVYPVCVYLLSPRRFRPLYMAGFAALVFCALVNSFFFYRDYGWLTPTLIFSNPLKQNMRIASDDLFFAANFAVLLLLCCAVIRLYFSRRRALLFSVQTAACAALLGWGSINVWKIHASFTQIKKSKTENAAAGYWGGGG